MARNKTLANLIMTDIFMLLFVSTLWMANGRTAQENPEILGPPMKVIKGGGEEKSEGGAMGAPSNMFLSVSGEADGFVFHLNKERKTASEVVKALRLARPGFLAIRVDREKCKDVALFVEFINEIRSAGVRKMAYTYTEE